jgi:hypothetical protein
VQHLATIQSNFHSNISSQQAIDDCLIELSSGNNLSTTKVLDGIWENSIGEARKSQRKSNLKELESVELLAERLNESYGRLKTLESQSKKFESDSKAYYDATDKVSCR